MRHVSNGLRCAIWRGGTSKGLFLLENDISSSGCERDQLLLKLFGSPDKRQIDGLGGADPLTSKSAIIGPSTVVDADIDYTYGMVSIEDPVVSWRGNCGNISAAVGPFAIDNGLVKAVEPITTVRIHNTNTKTIIVAEVPVKDGKPEFEGSYAIAGVPGTGAKISLNYSMTAGGVTGMLLPTGKTKDILPVHGVGDITVSIVDIANPEVFVLASTVGMRGTELPDDITPSLAEKLEAIRGTAAVKLGLASYPEKAYLESANIPHLVIVSPPNNYRSYTGKSISQKDISFVSRVMFMQKMHKTYPGTGSICTAVASYIPGTIVNDVIQKLQDENIVYIGHPSGIIGVETIVRKNNDGSFSVIRAVIGRTARKLMDGYAYI